MGNVLVQKMRGAEPSHELGVFNEKVTVDEIIEAMLGLGVAPHDIAGTYRVIPQGSIGDLIPPKPSYPAPIYPEQVDAYIKAHQPPAETEVYKALYIREREHAAEMERLRMCHAEELAIAREQHRRDICDFHKQQVEVMSALFQTLQMVNRDVAITIREYLHQQGFVETGVGQAAVEGLAPVPEADVDLGHPRRS